ncbi:hypothetical protein IKF12_02300 [Candidatus Saccharibacteria bacterium]|nr:hypothetical protein [Candidatus Saccharibacteria bacterium]
MKKQYLIAITVFVIGAVLCISGNSVYADEGGAVIGGGANAGTASPSGPDMGGDSGALGTRSWIFYAASDPGVVSQEINFVPDASFAGSDYWTNGNKIDKECSMHEDGGFWHYGDDRAARNYDTIVGGGPHFGIFAFLHNRRWVADDIEYSTELNKQGHYKSYDYSGLGRVNYSTSLLRQDIWVKNSSGGYDQIYEAAYYDDQYDSTGLGGDGFINNSNAAKDSTNALTHFMLAWAYKYDKGDTSKYPFRDANGRPRFPVASVDNVSVYYFCWWPGMVNKYYGKTDVSAGKKGEATSLSASTGIAEADSKNTANAGTLTVNKGKSAKINFSHTVYSQNSNETVKYNVPEIIINGGQQGDYAIVAGESTISRPRSGVANIGYGSEGGYYVKDGGGYVVNDEIIVEFKNSGTYTLCEVLYLDDSGAFTSQGCVKVKVNGDKEYLGVSNASVVKHSESTNGEYVTTGVVPQNSEETVTTSIKIDKNQKVDIVFSHNVYSTVAGSKQFWSVRRPDVSGFNPTSELAAISRDKVTFRTSHDDTADPHGLENGYYTAVYRQSTDGTWKYVLRDKYTLTFTKEGTYTFCEPLGIGSEYYYGSSSIFTSQSCVKVIVGDIPPCPEPCPQPEDPNPSGPEAGYSGVISLVRDYSLKNASNSNYGWHGTMNVIGENNDKNVVYAKPEDRIYWTNIYYPYAQVNASETITTRHDGVTNQASCEVTTHKKFSSAYSFNNSYSVNTTSPLGMNGWTFQQGNSLFTSGDLGAGTSAKQAVDGAKNAYIIAAKDAGAIFDDLISTDKYVPSYTEVGYNVHEWTYVVTIPRTCADGGSYVDAEGNTQYWYYEWDCSYDETRTASHPLYPFKYVADRLYSQSLVKIPYNFNNNATMNFHKDMVFSGESFDASDGNGVLSVKVNQRNNEVTDGNYATKVDDARVEIITYLSDKDQTGLEGKITKQDYEEHINDDICGYVYYIQGMCDTVYDSGKIALNSSGDISGGSPSTYNPGSYDVYDAMAGHYFCIVGAVYPASSGIEKDEKGDKNMSKNGDGAWRISSPQCSVIAKKPSIQIWGGGLFSNGSISTLVSEKQHIFSLGKQNGSILFGSWVEEDLIANGKVRNFASGAGLGKNSSISAGAGVTGKVDNKFCSDLVSLTFANKIGNSCSNGSVGYSGIESSMTNRESLVDYFAEIQTNESTSGNTYGIGNYVRKVSATGKIITYYDIDGDVPSLSGLVTVTNNTNIVKASGNIVISGNIYYSGPGSGFTSLSQIPKTVIYANKNIYIACNVSRIDAVLIAGGTIDTCYDGGDVNSYARSNQLLVNGVLIADKLIPGRTYGNTMGIVGGSWNVGSESPAEIINYDSSLLLWSQSMAGAAESDTLTVTYQHELAPRY